MKTSVFALNSSDWAQTFKMKGYSLSGLPFWLDGLYRNPDLLNRHISQVTLSEFNNQFDFSLPKIENIHESMDGTTKFQLQFKDGLSVETVLLPFHKRFTICLSTQVGCGMNCGFCYTGTQGLKRHLDAGEIVGQYLKAYQWLLIKNPKALKPSIVFMGQGEPLHNVDHVKKAIEVLTDTKCVGVGHRQITLSTVGYLPNIKELKSFPKINIALSLHSPFKHQRDELIPVNQRYPLADVLRELDELDLLKRQFITFEYLMIKNYNLTQAHADELARILAQRKALINLIPFNPFPGSRWQRPELDEIDNFKSQLVDHKLRVMVRGTKGDDILAACGQLKINQMARTYDGR